MRHTVNIPLLADFRLWGLFVLLVAYRPKAATLRSITPQSLRYKQNSIVGKRNEFTLRCTPLNIKTSSLN